MSAFDRYIERIKVAFGETGTDIDASASNPLPAGDPLRMRDVLGRVKVSETQNIYEADFEYGPQPLRWDSLALGAGTVTHLPGQGGVRLAVTTAAGDVAMRQSRPYHRYQPGKTMFMATAAMFGISEANNVQRIGFFDDSNGLFFEQAAPTLANPSGMFCVVRSDIGGVPVDTRISLESWNGSATIRDSLNWTRIQMLFIEYAWYGAGLLRWGVFIDGQPHILHQIGQGNRVGFQVPWARTGNLPVRYESRNTAGPAQANTLIHYGVSVMVEGRVDDQRGFTYSYGMAPATPRRTVSANVTRFPLLSIRARTMGTIEFTQANSASTAGTTTSLTVGGASWTVNQWTGRALFLPAAPIPAPTAAAISGQIGTITFASAHSLVVGQFFTLAGMTPSGWNGTWVVTSVTSATVITMAFVGTPPTVGSGMGTATTPTMARIMSNTATVLTVQDWITGAALPAALTASLNYQIGLVNRGQLLPRRLLVSASALCVVELICSTPASPVNLTAGASFASLASLGSANSFAERDVSATAMQGGEVVFAFTAPAGGSGLLALELDQLFPLYNTIRGIAPDLLTVAVSTPTGTAADVGAHIICQEAMS